MHGHMNIKKGVLVSFYRKRQSGIVTYYLVDGELLY